MPKKWIQKDIEAAFDAALKKAAGNKQLRRELLNDATAKSVFASNGVGDIDVPDEVEVIFYREEDLPRRLVMAIPAQPESGIPQPLQPTFKACFLCTYDTYVTRSEKDNKKLERTLKKLKLF